MQAGHWLLNMAGLVADAEDTQQTGAPEFPVAVRTQLLVGETSYAIQDQPAYAAAFTKMEHMEEDVCVKVCAGSCQQHAGRPGNAAVWIGLCRSSGLRVCPFLLNPTPPTTPAILLAGCAQGPVTQAAYVFW